MTTAPDRAHAPNPADGLEAAAVVCLRCAQPFTGSVCRCTLWNERDELDLKWWFCFAESDMGVHSGQGAQQDALQRRLPHYTPPPPWLNVNDLPPHADPTRPSAEPMTDARAEYNLTRARKTACPGCEPGVDCKHRAWDIAWPSPHLMEDRESRSTVIADPYPDEILRAIRRGRHIRATLVRMPDVRQYWLLGAVYGPIVGDRKDTMAIRKRLGELCEIAVSMMAASRDEGDESARRLVVRKLTDESYLTMARRASERYLHQAQSMYVTARMEGRR